LGSVVIQLYAGECTSSVDRALICRATCMTFSTGQNIQKHLSL